MNTTVYDLITKRPGRCGGEACVRDSRITVWGLVAWRKLNVSDGRILEMIAGLTPPDLEAAWKYFEDHPEEIERLIRENEQDPDASCLVRA